MNNLQGRTAVITGASRGIGRAMALKLASHGANVVIAAKSDTAHPKLPGTIHSVADEVEALGVEALPVKLDVRDQASVTEMAKAVEAKFGKLDILINNAGAIRLTGVEHTPVKRYDLMYQVNNRAVMLCSQALLPLLCKSDNAHILNLSPPLNLDPKWFKDYGPYTTTKYGMSMLTLGMAEEFRDRGIAVNSLWPKTTIATDAVKFEAGGEKLFPVSRTTDIMADAAHAIVSHTGNQLSGELLIDELILRRMGQTQFDQYAYVPGTTRFFTDLFVEE
ncbi:SDR family oxidoreductase [Ferrimonas kyonanensis]|uniref:SDR family oxidoreductase n=1 Tax=Ferrimonas kyonanensis TaxID=364763 RepID=UPI000409536C|nr:NAD(P)-dependent oxidoreductase [Ferrimonas kyonanensis]